MAHVTQPMGPEPQPTQPRHRREGLGRRGSGRPWHRGAGPSRQVPNLQPGRCSLSWSLLQGSKGEPGDKGSSGSPGARGPPGPKASAAPGTGPEPHVTRLSLLRVGRVCVHTGSGPGPEPLGGCARSGRLAGSGTLRRAH